MRNTWHLVRTGWASRRDIKGVCLRMSSCWRQETARLVVVGRRQRRLREKNFGREEGKSDGFRLLVDCSSAAPKGSVFCFCAPRPPPPVYPVDVFVPRASSLPSILFQSSLSFSLSLSPSGSSFGAAESDDFGSLTRLYPPAVLRVADGRRPLVNACRTLVAL
jgi:hypothetical protein